MKLTLTRTCTSDEGTFGMLSKEGVPLCNTVELPWRDNKPQVSCIPAGVYRVVFSYSPRFKRMLHQIQGVENRSGIRMHIANRAKELQGCIAPGTGLGTIGGQAAVMNSANALNQLHALLPQEWELEIVNAWKHE